MALDFMSRRAVRLILLASLLSLTLAVSAQGLRADQPVRTQLKGHLPPVISESQVVDRIAATERMDLTLTLPLRNQDKLDDLLSGLYDPEDVRYNRYLTPEEFTEQFGPSEEDYNAVVDYARSYGLTIKNAHPNRLLVDVSGTAGAVQRAFGVRMMLYQKPDGSLFRGPASEPVIPAGLVGRISGIVGLDNAATWHPHAILKPVDPLCFNDGLELGASAHSESLNPRSAGSGPGGGLTPGDIKTAYNLTGVSANGAGQVLGLFELDGYNPADVAAYEQRYGLPNVPLQNILLNGFSGAAGNHADEVTLDIELMAAMAPGAARIVIYESSNGAGILSAYNRMATDNIAKQISTSWGAPESQVSASMLNSENAIFKQMAAQGQSIYVAAGDTGANDNSVSLSVDDPASQPYVVATGGTSLLTNADGAWKAETAWSSGGGGFSKYWPMPAYQTGVISAASRGSNSARNLPDVSLNADPNTGYSAYYAGSWYLVGGTSCAAPLWAGFTALVNEERAAANKGLLGFPNPWLYQIGKSAGYTSNFHDIADGSSNGYFETVTGFDDVTGWGTINGVNLFTSLINISTGGNTRVGNPNPVPAQLLINPGFENGPKNPYPWNATAGVLNRTNGQKPHSGSYKAWLDGYGSNHTDTLSQQVSIPANYTNAVLTFYLHIDTAKNAKSKSTDTLSVQIRSASGALLSTLANYTNLNAASGYTQRSFNLSAYIGQTIQIYLIGVQNGSQQTSFVVDDFALNVQ